MTTAGDAAYLELLASYEELLTLTTRALELARELADAHVRGESPANLQSTRDEILRTQRSLATLNSRVAKYKGLFKTH